MSSAAIDLSFHVGPKKRVDVSIPLSTPSDECESLLGAGEASVREFVSQEDIPFPLEEPLVRCTELALRSAGESELSCLCQPAQGETRRRQAEAWASLYNQKAKSGTDANGQIGWAGSQKLMATENETGRSRTFNDVVRSSQKNVERLVEFEDSLEISLSVMREGKKRAIEEAQDRQAREMEREVMRNRTPDHLAALVSAQIEEMDAIGALWAKKEEDETRQQQERYSSLVTSLAAAERDAQEHAGRTPQKSIVKVNELNISFPFYTGQGQLKTLYKVEVTCANPVPDLFEASTGIVGKRDRLVRRERTLQSLYSRGTVGLVLPVPSSGTSLNEALEASEWQCCRELYRAVGSTFDMHFGSISQQLENTPKTLTAGDVCVTRHSNMLDLHVVFHLILNRFDDIVKESATKSKSKTLDGLWRTMMIAARHDVSELVIPVPLIESSLPKNASADETILQLSKNAEIIIRNIKSFLSVHHPESLKRVILAIRPTPHSVAILEKIRTSAIFGN